MQLKLTLLTPGFVGGTMPRQADPFMPLRPPAVRGLLRTWFRMAVAGLFWPRSTEATHQREFVDILRDVEARYFGATDTRSPFAVSLDESPQPQQFPTPASPTSGLRYLGYGLFEKGTASVLPDGKQYEVSLRIRPGLDRKLSEALERILTATVWLWTHLGGVGARSRRGFGSLELQYDPSRTDWKRELYDRCKDITALEIQQRLGLNAALDEFEDVLANDFYANPDPGGPHRAIRNLLSPELTVLPATFATGLTALEQVGTLLQQFRSTRARLARKESRLPDYFVVRNVIQTGTPPNQSVGRSAFGLPLRFFFSSLQGQSATLVPPNDKGDRVPSPLHIRVHRLASGRCAVMLINLASDPRTPPLLDLDHLVMKTRGTNYDVPIPDGSFLTDFVRFAVIQSGKQGVQ